MNVREMASPQLLQEFRDTCILLGRNVDDIEKRKKLSKSADLMQAEIDRRISWG